MGLLTFIRKLLSRVSLPPKPASLYADYTKRTRSGKLRARASPGDWGERFGTDETIHQVEGISQSAKKVYRYLSAIADKDGYCFPFYKTIGEEPAYRSPRFGKPSTTLKPLASSPENNG